MKRKIYWNICLMAMFSMAAAILLMAWILNRNLQAQMRQSVQTETRYLEAALEKAGPDFLSSLVGHGDGSRLNRISWIDADGTVVYDSYADSESLENHSGRPEVAQALQTGREQNTRLSNTLTEQTYYYAVRLDDGSVIRVARTTRSVLAVIVDTIPWMAAMAAAILAVTMLLARRQTRRIVEPINQLDPDHPQDGYVYDELSPLVRRMEKQKGTIQKQIRTMREKQEEFTAITENMREGFIIVNSHADVISYNSSAIRILGVDLKHNDGATINVLSMNRSSTFRQVVDAALRGEHGEQMLRLNGRCYQLIANPVSEGGDRRGAVVVILDVTEQQSRDELRREFTANVSHELKTPLTSISGYAEIMKNGLVQPEDMGRFSEKIYTEAQRLITLVGDIIRLSQLDEENVGVENTSVDLYLLAGDILDRLREPAATAKVSLVQKGEAAVVCGAAPILDEMIFNLCDNSIKYNRSGGYVIVTTGVENGHPVVSVEDNGIGIPDADKEHIFERFYRVDKSHSRQIGGTGLGLSIVKHGAIYHKARVEMESRLGKGTTVRIVFPQAAVEA